MHSEKRRPCAALRKFSKKINEKNDIMIRTMKEEKDLPYSDI
jgi:hypothetical protein